MTTYMELSKIAEEKRGVIYPVKKENGDSTIDLADSFTGSAHPVGHNNPPVLVNAPVDVIKIETENPINRIGYIAAAESGKRSPHPSFAPVTM